MKTNDSGSKFSGFLLSVPERIVRSAAGLVAGLARAISSHVLPRAVRQTLVYRLMIENTLQFLIQEIGEVEGVYDATQPLADHFAIRRAASHGIEAAGILAFHASPVWVLAALADLSGAGRSLIPEISVALREEGLLSVEDHPFDTVDKLLDGLERSAGHLALTANSPPLNIGEIRSEWEKLRSELPDPMVFPAIDVLTRTWRKLTETAGEERVSIFRVSSLLALSAIRKLPSNLLWLSRASRLAGKKTGELLVKRLLDDYMNSLVQIRRNGYLRFWIAEFTPYVRATSRQFSRDHVSLTEKLLSRVGGNVSK